MNLKTKMIALDPRRVDREIITSPTWILADNAVAIRRASLRRPVQTLLELVRPCGRISDQTDAEVERALFTGDASVVWTAHAEIDVYRRLEPRRFRSVCGTDVGVPRRWLRLRRLDHVGAELFGASDGRHALRDAVEPVNAVAVLTVTGWSA